MANPDAGGRWTLTVPEAAHGLKISRTLAYQMARSGELPTIRMGRRLLVPRAALDRLFAATVRQAPGFSDKSAT